MGRFISQDPIKDGVNWYAYCYDNPVNRIDPDGRVSHGSIYAAPQYCFENFYTKLTYGVTTTDRGLVGQLASVRTEVNGNANVSRSGSSITINLSVYIGATSSFSRESGISVASNVNAVVAIVDSHGNIVASQQVFIGSTGAQLPGTPPEQLFDTGTSQNLFFDNLNPFFNYGVKITIDGSFGNDDGEAMVVSRSFGGEVENIDIPATGDLNDGGQAW